MLLHGSSRLRSAVLTAAALVLSSSAAGTARAQRPIPTGGAQSYREPGPITPEIYEAGGGQTRTNTGQSTSQPVFTPGYFEVVCPAICYGGAFHLCGVKAFGGPGYYGPLRRYWAYSTYGPNFNIGPDNSLQYGLIGGVVYVAQRACQGCYKHGGDCACHCVLCPKGGGSLAGIYGPVGQMSLLQGASQQPTGQLPQPAPNAAGQPTEKLPPPTEKLSPPTGNSAHLRIRVPKDAEVLVEGRQTTATGAVREFVSPPLTPGKNMIYSILVRYTDGGKKIEETHAIRVHANARLDIDCTKPTNAEPSRATVQRP